jgi:osmotically-inducible protein OsmY
MNKNTLATAIIITMLPLGAYAGAADSVGSGISDVVGGVGDAVKDVGTGVGNGVSDIGNGIGNAFSSDKSTQNAVPSDTTITNTANSNINKLAADNKIKAGYDLQTATVNGVVVISGEVTDAADVNTIKDAIIVIPGVKSVNTQNIIVK